METKERWFWNSVGFSPVILSGLIGWILDWAFNVTIWSLYWALGFSGCVLSTMVFCCFVLKKTQGERDEENKEDEEDNE